MNNLQVGEIVAPHGMKGHVRVKHWTDDLARLAEIEAVYIGNDPVLRAVEESFIHKNLVVLKIEGIDTRDQSEALRGTILSIPYEARKELTEDEFFLSDLVGLKVHTVDEIDLGQVEDIISTGSHEVLVIANDEREIMIPFVKEFVKDVSADGIVVDPIKGMI